ncbi:PKS-NRPS hybrid synthetase [Fusarium oxysporum f. sp. conglutinans]|nr:PKS-NRPS hybrid synthetase [Fusarium oxysporum f. sp. conglutinans]
MEQSSPDPFQQPQQRKRKRRANSNLRQPSPSDYPLEDTGALENIFASYPQTLSTVPRPEGMRGLNEPSWALQFDHDIHLSNDYPVPNGQPTRVRGPIPGPEPIPYPSQPSDATEEQHNTQSPRAKFKSALQLVTDVIGTERRLTRESLEAAERVRQWREQWGYSSLSPGQSISPPPYSPPRKAQHTNTRLLSSPRDIELQDQTLDSSPEPTQIPNPPIPGTAAPSVDVLFKEVNSFAKAHGFGIVKYNGYTYKGRKIRYSFQCDRYGEPQPSKGAQIRPRKSRKCGCKWKLIAEALEEGKWLLRLHNNPEHHQHNHGPSIGPSAHPSHRRLTEATKATIISTSRRVGVRARDVRAVIQEQYPDSTFTRKDIYNARSLINREKLGGLTPTAALIKLFDDNEIPYLIKWADDDPDRLLGLVWTFPYCLQMWKRFPEVISFDNTYNTNRFKLPLFQATGQTCLGSVFNAAFGLIDNERREGFQFLSESIKQLMEQHSIRQPDVIITDFDDSMKAALNDQFPDIQKQLCIHHINSNVLLRAKQRWLKRPSSSSDISGGSDIEADPPDQIQLNPTDQESISAPVGNDISHTYSGVLAMWKLVLFAETEEAHEKAWINLCKEFNDQSPILRYLHGTYMPVRAQWARCFIRHYRNFGIRVTSGTEASNNNIKGYLLNGMSHLYRLVEAMQDMLRDQRQDFVDACANDEVLTAPEYHRLSTDYLGELRTLVSSKCLALITTQYRLAKKAMPTGNRPFPPPLNSFVCSVPTELGIPCYHTIYDKISSGTSFTNRKCTRVGVYGSHHLETPTDG